MDKLTKKERDWLAEVNAVIARCPSTRLEFYTIGDKQINVFDKRHMKTASDENDDLVCILNRDGGHMDGCEIYFPASVNGVCG